MAVKKEKKDGALQKTRNTAKKNASHLKNPLRNKQYTPHPKRLSAWSGRRNLRRSKRGKRPPPRSRSNRGRRLSLPS